MASTSTALATALAHHQGGRLPAAEQIYRQILADDPNQPDALHLLGVLARQMGQHLAAVELIGRAVQLKGTAADFHFNLGGAYLDLKKFPEAAECFRRAVTLKPDYALAYSNLGQALRELGLHEHAIEQCHRALALNPELVDGHFHLGNVLLDQGQLELAVASYQRALERNPNLTVGHNNLGNAFRDLGMLDHAVASYRRALELSPGMAEIHNNLGNAWRDLGRFDEAIGCFSRALELNPESAEAFNNLGNVLIDLQKFDDAVACCRRALQLKPNYTKAENNLGNALMALGQSDEAIACYQRVLEATPNDAVVYNNLGGALQAQGKREQASACYSKALELKPDFAQAHSNVLLLLQYRDDVTLASLFEAHAEFDHRHAAVFDSRSVPGRGDFVRIPHGRLRLGFVSADLGRHPVGYFLIGVLENLNRDSVETYCYSDGIRNDDLTERLRSSATHWRETIGLGDEQLAEQIRADQIDVLFDLAGHTAHNRLLAFARKPAPFQVTWAGYASTTGLRALAFILADRYEIPPESESYYHERVLRMPDGYVCYEPPEYAPPVSSLPALTCGHVTFGCFNNPAKITPQVVDVFSKILVQVPNSRLVLKYKGWNDPSIVGQVLERLDSRIDPTRIEFQGSSPHADLLRQYHRIDLALDSFPYSGGLTTCEALWMGVPVVTCPGETFASRHSLSHLSNIGLTETIASDFDQYVDKAVTLAGDLARLAKLRAGLREQMAASPLCDGKKFADHLTAILTKLVQ